MQSPYLERLLDIMTVLRSENGCPWDKKQTMQSLRPYLIEETYEVIDAMESGSAAAHREELGDLLLQIVFQSQIASENGDFSFDDVAKEITEKLIRRHPHVFADAIADTPEQVIENWEAIKKTEKALERKSVLDGIPKSLPALQKAQHMQSKAARVGFDWKESRDVLAKVHEELEEVEDALISENSERIKEELGDLLFSIVNLARFTGHDAEYTLHAAAHKFARRFKAVEHMFSEENKEMTACSLEELDAAWEMVKKRE